MSRFDMGRRSRILAWTGAAMAWGTALTMGVQSEKPEAGSSSESAQLSAAVPASQGGVMPKPPARGLVILRFQPSEASTTEVATVYVREQAPSGPPAETAEAPAPQSSGS